MSDMLHITPIKNDQATPLVLLLDYPYLTKNYRGHLLTIGIKLLSNYRGNIYIWKGNLKGVVIILMQLAISESLVILTGSI